VSRATSIEAYRELSKTDHFSELQVQILDSLREYGPATRKQLAARLNRPINSVCDPSLRLIEAGRISEVIGVDEETGRKIGYLSIPGQTKPRKQLQAAKQDQHPEITKNPTGKELLCSAILSSKFERTGDCYTTQVMVNGVIMVITVTPVTKVGE
jgi:DNA-binding MarR family transcriptional regulator